MSRAPQDLLNATSAALDAVRDRAPLVHCITNAVVVNVTANLLLALGASPAMADVPGEAGPFAGVADALLVNLGTPHAEQREAMLDAVPAARAAGTPWVLDPVAVGMLPVRTELAGRLIDLGPAIIRGNASEIIALSGAGSGGRGVDTVDTVETAHPAAMWLAEMTGAVVVVSGPIDLITDGHDVTRIDNGHPLLTRITGGGCALGAVMAAFAAVVADPYVAAVAATTVYTVAAQSAATAAPGPGSFAAALLDALDRVDGRALADRARLS